MLHGEDGRGPGARRPSQHTAVDALLEALGWIDVPPMLFAAVGVLFLLVLMVIFCSLSLGAVPPLEYGIRYNMFNKYADVVNVYTSGRYLIWPWSKFLLFPASAKNVEFTDEPRLAVIGGLRYPSLHTRTKEGLALQMQVSLQYRLLNDQVGYLYQEFNNSYEGMFVSTIRNALIESAADYEAPQLWANRSSVGHMMQATVDTALQRMFATCWGLQLMVIELPESYEDSIVTTQVQNQQIATNQFEQQATQTRAETEVIKSDYERQMKVINADGLANYTVVTRTAKANASRYTLNAEADVLDTIKGKLGLNDDELVEYQRLTAVQLQGNASLYYGFDVGAQVMLQAPDEPPSRSSSKASSVSDVLITRITNTSLNSSVLASSSLTPSTRRLSGREHAEL